MVPPMIIEGMRMAIKRSTAGDLSLGMDGIGKPPWHALAQVLAKAMTITMQWQLATGYILGAVDHGIRTHVHRKDTPPVVANTHVANCFALYGKIPRYFPWGFFQIAGNSLWVLEPLLVKRGGQFLRKNRTPRIHPLPAPDPLFVLKQLFVFSF